MYETQSIVSVTLKINRSVLLIASQRLHIVGVRSTLLVTRAELAAPYYQAPRRAVRERSSNYGLLINHYSN